MIKILILGSNSFAGASFVNFCLNHNCRVVGLSRSPEPHPTLLPYNLNSHISNFNFIQTDLNKDFGVIENILKEFSPEYIADFAGQGMVAQSWSQPWQWYQTNVVAKARLHEVLRKLPSLKSYMRISTPEVYGHTEGYVKESAPLNPSTPYAVSHAAADMSLMAFHRQYSFPVVFSRSANFYGPGQQLYRIIPRTIIYARLGRKLKLDGGGYSIRSFINSDDFCRASWNIMTNGKHGEIYHIAPEEYISIRNLVSLIADKLNITFHDLAEDGPERPGKDKSYYLDCTKTKSTLNWSQKVLLDEGINQVIKWIDRDLDQIKQLPLEYVHKE